MLRYFVQKDTFNILISTASKDFVTLAASLKRFAKYRTGKKFQRKKSQFLIPAKVYLFLLVHAKKYEK